MNPTHLYRYLLRFFLCITWLTPHAIKATEELNINRSPTTSKINSTWHPYPCAIQLRPGLMIDENRDHFTANKGQPSSSNQPIVIIPTTIDIDILYVHSSFASQLESYPRMGLSLCLPYALKKEQQLSFPNIWGISAYIELYQAHPAIPTWGNRISIGVVKGGALFKIKEQPTYSFLGAKEIAYHWPCTRSWQLNFGIGLLINWWSKNRQATPTVNNIGTTNHLMTTKATSNSADNDSIKLKFAPLATIGIRYTAHTEPFLRQGDYPIHYRKRKGSRVDCSIVGSSRYLASTKKYYPIFRGSSLLSFAINAQNALLFSLELGYNLHKKAFLANTTSAGSIEFTALLGYEIRYGHYLLQIQLGCVLTDTTKPNIQTTPKDVIGDALNERGVFSVNAQYMLTERFFMGITVRPQEIPGIRLGVSL